MGNATPEIQKKAKRVTLPQPQAGVATVIDALLAGQLEP
jgi:hydroxymethylpyrimidine pyrophosphatase-like HAD family hydrolase